MTTTADSMQLLLIAEIGDTPDGLLWQQMATIWDSYADKAAVAPRLQELYAKRRAIDLVLATLRNQVDMSMSGDLSLRLSERTRYLTERRAETQTEIQTVETRARANRLPAAGPLINVELETPPVLPPAPDVAPDANAEWYRGSPYFAGGRGLP